MAVKVVEKRRRGGMLDDRLLRREIDIGRRVAESGSDMLLPVIDAADVGHALLLVMGRASGALTDIPMPSPETEVMSILADIATGLQQAHSIGIIHRDLKPPNVLHHKGRWKLADFGIARDQEIGTQDPTFLGWGSPPYMAPELWDRKSPTVKTDLYALGCIGYELLTGTPPYMGDQAAIREGHLAGPIPAVECDNVVLGNLITRLMAKDPGGRPQDARAVLDRLRRASTTLGPGLAAAERGLAKRAAEESNEAAKEAASKAAAERLRQLIMQALQELREIIEDAAESLGADAKIAEEFILSHHHLYHYFRNFGEETPRIRGSGGVGTYGFRTDYAPIYLSAGGAAIRISLWKYSEDPDTEPTLVGDVAMTSDRYYMTLNTANLAYDRTDDGRMAWRVFRFIGSQQLSENHDHYPSERVHGLEHSQFARDFNLYRAQGWKLSIDSICGLLGEALQL